VHDALRQPTAPSLILLYGPTGVGKTTLRLRLEQQLITEALPALEKDTARVPVPAVEAIAPESGQFNWKVFFARACKLE
jgi:replication-associated recombination protein RarA